MIISNKQLCELKGCLIFAVPWHRHLIYGAGVYAKLAYLVIEADEREVSGLLLNIPYTLISLTYAKARRALSQSGLRNLEVGFGGPSNTDMWYLILPPGREVTSKPNLYSIASFEVSNVCSLNQQMLELLGGSGISFIGRVVVDAAKFMEQIGTLWFPFPLQSFHQLSCIERTYDAYWAESRMTPGNFPEPAIDGYFLH